MSREQLEAHAAACREAVAEGCERPRWVGGSLAGMDLSGANLSGAALHWADLTEADLTGADLSGADLTGANLTGAGLSGANLTGARLVRAGLTCANLARANLVRADLFTADLTGADLTGATLTEANLFRATLIGADLTGAHLTEGVARGRAVGGESGVYLWWAVALVGGGAVLQYGCERRLLAWWLAQGPQLSVRHGHPASHWEEGPAVAIAAAVGLSQALPAGVRR